VDEDSSRPRYVGRKAVDIKRLNMGMIYIYIYIHCIYTTIIDGKVLLL